MAFEKVAPPGAIEEGSGKLHLKIEGRYVTVLRHQGQLYCIDSSCFHAGGPLVLGEIEDLNGQPCLTCPWHFYKVALSTGEKFYQPLEIQHCADSQVKQTVGPWKSVGQRQRVHKVEERSDGIYVELQLEGSMPSDEYAHKAECGERVKKGALRLHVPPPDVSRRSPSPLANRRSFEGEDRWVEDIVPPPSPSRQFTPQ